MMGFMTNAAAVTGITNAWNAGKGIKLEAATGADEFASAIPNGCYISHVTVKTDETGAGCTTLQAAITWDAAGDDLLMGPTDASSVFNGLTDTSLRMVSFKADAWVRSTSDQDADGELYLWLQTDAGTVTVPIGGVKLHWSTRPTRP